MNGKYLKELAGLSILSAIFESGNPFGGRPFGGLDDDGDDVLEKLNEPKPKVIPAGCKEYTFHGITVVAISEKSARKKIERRLKNAK